MLAKINIVYNWALCVSLFVYVPYSRPNSWADPDETWHTD